jgi:hypothetical protein
MKKFSLFIVSSIVAATLTACGSYGTDVAQMEFVVDDGSIPPQYYSVSTLVIEPNYEDKTLSIDYSSVYPDRTEETEEEDVQTSSIVGEAYFDTFQDLSGLMKDFDDSYEFDSIDSVGSGNFSVSISNSKKPLAEIDTLWADDNADVEALRNFYLELVNLLAGDVQV